MWTLKGIVPQEFAVWVRLFIGQDQLLPGVFAGFLAPGQEIVLWFWFKLNI